MANANRGEVALGPHVLRFDVNALCDVEDAVGESIIDVLTGFEGGGKQPSFKLIRLLFLAGLRGSRPDLTLKQAGDIVQEVGFNPAVEALGEALTASFGLAEGDTGKNR